jgi:hypothetical protein
MNGLAIVGFRNGMPATRVMRLDKDRTISGGHHVKTDEVLLAAVIHPPRIGEVRPIAALMPEVLARYGLDPDAGAGEGIPETSVDLLA